MVSNSALTGVALITGAGSGIGACTARSFLAKGVKRFVLVDFVPTGLKKLEAELKGAGAEVLVVSGDVTKEADVKNSVEQAVATFGRIDYCVNSAGIAALGTLLETSVDDWNKTMNINTLGVFLCVREQTAQMLKQDRLAADQSDPKRQQRGSIVNLASILGTVAVPSASAYVASKHAVVGLAKAAASEHAINGIRVNNIAPGWIDTPMTNNPHVGATLKEQTQTNKTPLGRPGFPEEIADVIVFLSSTEASLANGATWLVDGGFTSL